MYHSPLGLFFRGPPSGSSTVEASVLFKLSRVRSSLNSGPTGNWDPRSQTPPLQLFPPISGPRPPFQTTPAMYSLPSAPPSASPLSCPLWHIHTLLLSMTTTLTLPTQDPRLDGSQSNTLPWVFLLEILPLTWKGHSPACFPVPGPRCQARNKGSSPGPESATSGNCPLPVSGACPTS